MERWSVPALGADRLTEAWFERLRVPPPHETSGDWARMDCEPFFEILFTRWILPCRERSIICLVVLIPKRNDWLGE